MLSFRDQISGDRRDHLGWAEGHVCRTDLREDSAGLAHLQNLQHTPIDAMETHDIHPAEMERLRAHHAQMRADSTGRSRWEGEGSIPVHKLEPYTAMKHYKENSSKIFNDPLRRAYHHDDGSMELQTQRHGGNDFFRHTHDEVHHAISQLDHATGQQTRSPLTLYRGIYRSSGIHRMAPGDTFVDHGYTGTSLKKSVADEFSDVHTDWGHQYEGIPRDLVGKLPVARIHAPAGTKGHFLDVDGHAFSPHASEREFLLHRGTHFQVMGHTRTSQNHVVHLRVIGSQPKPIQYHGYFRGNPPEDTAPE